MDYPTYTWNQKLTIEVSSGDKLFTGSSIINVSVAHQPSFGLIGIYRFRYEGEATVVALPNGKKIFALLYKPYDNGYSEYLAFNVWSDLVLSHGDGSAGRGIYRSLSRLRDARDIPPKLYPLLVTFRNEHDPSSVVELTPDNIAAELGDGFSIKRIELAITDEKVTDGPIEAALPWLSEYAARHVRLNGEGCVVCPQKSINFADVIDASSFKVSTK